MTRALRVSTSTLEIRGSWPTVVAICVRLWVPLGALCVGLRQEVAPKTVDNANLGSAAARCRADHGLPPIVLKKGVAPVLGA